MSDLLRKLNVLVRAGLNDLLDTERSATPASQPDILSSQSVDREVRVLRRRVNDALEYEDKLQARVESLRAEVESLDQQADEALSQDMEEIARRALRDLQVARQRLEVAEADLQDHRSVTEDLMLRVNELDAAAADLRHAQANPASEGDVMQQASQAMGEVLQQMRERIAHFSAMEESAAEVNPPVDETAVDDDLARRVERLSKK